MRKFLFSTLFLFLATIVGVAQNTVNFKINAARTEYTLPNSTKNYYVFNYPDKTQKELFDEVLKGIYKTGRMRDLRVIDNSIIESRTDFDFRTANDELIYLRYSIQFELKDGKIRVNAPVFIFKYDPDDAKCIKLASLSNLNIINKYINEVLSYIYTGNDW